MDYKYIVDIHTHTQVSTHAYSNIHDYIVEAKKKGIVLFATTDHGPEMHDAPHRWHFVNSVIIPRLVDGIAILRGIEANIQDEFGNIDCDEDMMKSLDIVLAGFHKQVFAPADRDTNTRAMINTIKSGKVDVITHPGNPKYPIHIEQVAKTAAHCNVALEINNSSFRFSRAGSEISCLAIAKAVRDAGGWVSLGSDAHISFDLGRFDKCLEILNKVDFPIDRILNDSPAKLLKFLESRGHPHIHDFEFL